MIAAVRRPPAGDVAVIASATVLDALVGDLAGGDGIGPDA